MKILIAGHWKGNVYEPACADALEKLGVETEAFRWGPYFSGLGRLDFWLTAPLLKARQMNRDLLAAAREYKPDVIFFWRPTLVLPATLRKLRSSTPPKLVCFNNDDPFSPGYARYFHGSRLWRYYLQCVGEYDLHFVYRRVNLEEVRAAGARRAELLMPYFVPELHGPRTLDPSERRKFECDVVFAGHYEPDGRVDCIRALVKAGLKVRLYGGSELWTTEVLGDLAADFWPVKLILGDDYAKALCGAKVALCFVSKLNRDLYTRRTFEIPACRTVMLAERTRDHETLFKENEEAVFFSSPEEVVEKACKLVSDEALRQSIAEAGWRRVYADRHSVNDRMREFLAVVASL